MDKMDEKDVRDRLIWLIDEQIRTRNRYDHLEQRYGIAARKWKNVCNRIQQPSLEMLTAIARDYPGYVTWLLTGAATKVMQVDPTADGHEDSESYTDVRDFLQYRRLVRLRKLKDLVTQTYDSEIDAERRLASRRGTEFFEPSEIDIQMLDEPTERRLTSVQEWHNERSRKAETNDRDQK